MGKFRYYLDKAAKRGFRGYPVATIAFYGPTSDFASKAVVSVFRAEAAEPDALERFFSEDSDVRFDETIGSQVLELIRLHPVQSVVMVDRIIGCPHEEGVDYPEGSSCRQCPFWAGRDRWTGERLH